MNDSDPFISLFEFSSPEEIWNEHREVTRGRDLDITGLSYAILEEQGPQQWPFPEGAASGKARLYEDGLFPTPSGRARFFAERARPVAEPVDARYPLRLTTGRLRDHWHGLSRTGTVASLFGHVPEPRLGMNPGDMDRRGIHSGELVCVQSRRGALYVIVESDESMRSGQAYLPMHWGKRFLGGQASAGTNTVTVPAFDPFSRQPELKHAAVRVTGADLAWHLVAFAEIDALQLCGAMDRWQALQDEVTFASAVPIGRDRPGLLVRAAHAQAPSPQWLDAVDAIFDLHGPDVMRYDDARRAHSRRIRIAADRLLGVRLAGDASAVTSGDWLRDWLVGGRPIAEVRRLLLSPAHRAPTSFVLCGRVVCQCFNVAEPEIAAALAAVEGSPRERLEALERQLKCGTHCGSCKPELRALAESVAPKARRMVA